MVTDQPTPRRKWHLKRWLIIFAVAFFAWSWWRDVALRSAIKEAEALGWVVLYSTPAKAIQADWKNAFRMKMWANRVNWLNIQTSESFEQHVSIARRLNPRSLRIADCSKLRDFSVIGSLTTLQNLQLVGCTRLTNIDALKNLSALKWIDLSECTGLTNVDALKLLPTLQELELSGCTGLTNVDGLQRLFSLRRVWLTGCTGLTNVDALKLLPDLKEVVLTGCTGLTRESVDALKAALPNTAVVGP